MRILTGIRPTGRLHLGHLVGQIGPLLELQHRCECYLEIADWHALTTGRFDPGVMRRRVLEVALDWIAPGLDPEKNVFFVQSEVPEHAELHLLFTMLTTVARVERCPTYKEKSEELAQPDHQGPPQPDHPRSDNASLGLLSYPVLQAADILIYRADAVPVGEDQLPHLELCRETARRFNRIFGQTFPEPEPILSNAPRLPGIDGQMKMSKSRGNTIDLAHHPEEIRERVMSMVTDPRKIHRTDPGRPSVCTVFNHFRIFDGETASEVEEACRSAGTGCVACKRKLADTLAALLKPVQESRREIAEKPGYLEEIVHEGSRRARRVARKTLEEVRAKMGMDYRLAEERMAELGAGRHPRPAGEANTARRHGGTSKGAETAMDEGPHPQESMAPVGGSPRQLPVHRRRGFASGFSGLEFGSSSSPPPELAAPKGGLLGC